MIQSSIIETYTRTKCTQSFSIHITHYSINLFERANSRCFLTKNFVTLQDKESITCRLAYVCGINV